MKKYFILAAAAILTIAACSKSEIDNTNSGPKEISYNAVTAKNQMTKAINNKTFYAPGDPSFGIWGLYNAESWAADPDAAASYWVGTNASTPAHITYQTNAWKNSTINYWPITGSLTFMGYSPFNYWGATEETATAVPASLSKSTVTYENAETHENETTDCVLLSVSNFSSSTGSFVTDLMWSDAVERTYATANTNYDADGNNTTTYNGVPVVFHHALSQIAVYASTDHDYANEDYTFTITAMSMTIDDNATLTVKDNLVNDPTVSWTEPATDATRTILPANSTSVLSTSVVAQGDPFLVIPQALSGNDILTITYQVAHNNVVSTVTKTINLYAGETDLSDENHNDDYLASFVKNTKYNLNLVFSLEEIKYSPSISAWEGPEDVEYEVPHDANN